jgi:hypothetical protein
MKSFPDFAHMGYSMSDLKDKGFFFLENLVIRHYFPKINHVENDNTIRTLDVCDKVRVKFNPPAFFDLSEQAHTYEQRKIGDLYVLKTYLPELRLWLLPEEIMKPLKEKPRWDVYEQFIQQWMEGVTVSALKKGKGFPCYLGHVDSDSRVN